ncbi:ybiA [Symbiodinium natans]|uniref:Palmitoyltransferase n=1 Tax=Symbiodinium natans TaxID=878477 RepID=A0A812HVD4_9DINO|nr:ybiA [Symbiodinium natans]
MAEYVLPLAVSCSLAQEARHAPEPSPDATSSVDVAQLIIILTKSFAVVLFVYGGYAYNAVFLSRILQAAGKENFVLPFAVMFNFFYILGLFSYVAATLADPGSVPERWLSFVERVEKQLPVANPRAEWQPSKATRCKKCNIIRPERAHHCHFCRRCILRMDHHCPWINNCVGMHNHKYFTLLGIYAGLASFIALSTILPDLLTCLSSVLRMDGDLTYGPSFTKHSGYLPAGSNVLEAMMTIPEAKEKCAGMKTCKGFCYIGEDSGLPLKIYFKDKWQFWPDKNSHWTSYRYEQAASLDDTYVFQFLLLGCVVMAANALLVPLNCSHLPNLLDNVTMIESNYDNMPNPFDQGSGMSNMAQIFGSPGGDLMLVLTSCAFQTLALTRFDHSATRHGTMAAMARTAGAKPIIHFSGQIPELRWLDNLCCAGYPIEIEGLQWPSTEHYFQAQKFLSTCPELMERIRSLPADSVESNFEAKRLGRSGRLRSDWEQVKYAVMRTAVLAKFSQHEDLRRRLLQDIPREAIFVEHCADAEWGDGGDGSGKNLFGKVLTEVRDTLAKQEGDSLSQETEGQRHVSETVGAHA